MGDEGWISALLFASAVLCTHWDEVAAFFADSPGDGSGATMDLSELRCRVEEIGEGKVRIRITPGELARARGEGEG